MLADLSHVTEDAPALPGYETTLKRRRDDQEQCTIDRRPLTIRPDTSQLYLRPRTFTPICLLPRSHLPLSFLDTAIDGSRLFAAHVQTLEACHEYGERLSVLIVEDERDNRLYAIERVQRQKYVLCRLGSWVKQDDLVKHNVSDAGLGAPPAKRHAVQSDNEDRLWWKTIAVDVTQEKLGSAKPNGHRLSMMPNNDSSLAQASPSVEAAHPQAIEPQLKPVSLEESLEELTKQYLDALYLSRLPVAYFVKGPLTRVRAATSSQPRDLIAFLRGAILSSSVMEKKYRDGISDIVKELPVLDTPEEKSKTRKKRKWKPKRDKYGFFAEEKDYVEKWWRKDEDLNDTPSTAEAMEATIKRRSQRLRNRETFYLAILILEVMALEASTPVEPQPVEKMQALETQLLHTESETAQIEQKARRKKEVDIASILETLLDRLCIWYSLEENSPDKTKMGGNGSMKEVARDELKSFAAEVVIPFYGSRIPEQAYDTSKKLGGPTAPTAAPRKPGEPALRKAPEKKPRKPLQRVSTDTLNRTSNRPPMLHRSATDSVALAPLIKREMSQAPPLHSIPSKKLNRWQPLPVGERKRPSLLEQAYHRKREVDLSAMSQANEAKLRKKADVQEKLREAIATAKKPNRDRAVEEIAQNADQSFAKAISRSKTISAGHAPRKTVDRTANASAVNATPHRIIATPASKWRKPGGSGGTSIVPSSSSRLFAQPGDLSSSSLAIPQTGHRPRHTTDDADMTSGFMPTGLTMDNSGAMLESPIARRTVAVAQTPSKQFRTPCLSETPLKTIDSTPNRLRGRTYSPIKLLSGVETSTASQWGKADISLEIERSGGDSIYKDMGWEDDYEELS